MLVLLRLLLVVKIAKWELRTPRESPPDLDPATVTMHSVAASAGIVVAVAVVVVVVVAEDSLCRGPDI